LSENVNWSLVFTALATVFSFIAAITEIYYRVHIPRTKDKERKREDIYKPLLKDVDALIESIEKRTKFSPPFNWRTVEEKVSPKFFEKLNDLFDVRADRYYKLLEHNREFVRLQVYFYLDKNLENLKTEFKNLGVGGLESELYQVIVSPILEGEKISLRWLEDNKPELFENLKKCPSCKNIKSLLDWLNEESPCGIYYKNAEHDLLQSAEKIKRELKRF